MMVLIIMSRSNSGLIYPGKIDIIAKTVFSFNPYTFFQFYYFKVCYEPRRPTRPALISGFCSMKQVGVFLLPPGWDASPS